MVLCTVVYTSNNFVVEHAASLHVIVYITQRCVEDDHQMVEC